MTVSSKATPALLVCVIIAQGFLFWSRPATEGRRPGPFVPLSAKKADGLGELEREGVGTVEKRAHVGPVDSSGISRVSPSIVPSDAWVSQKEFAVRFSDSLTSTPAVGSEWQLRRYQGMLADLTPEMADVFISRFRDPERRRFRNKYLEWALISGGGLSLLLEILSDNTEYMEYRGAITWSLLRDHTVLPRRPRLPVNPNVMDEAFRRVTAVDPEDRRLAVALLAHQDGDVARAKLESVAANDADVRVRVAAINALEFSAIPNTVQFLERLGGGQPTYEWGFLKDDPSDEAKIRAAIAEVYLALKNRFQ
jgi:ketosteroid isomerase-like protein